ncbi:MAG: CvpA family protein [Planctomycetota bacterium]
MSTLHDRLAALALPRGGASPSRQTEGHPAPGEETAEGLAEGLGDAAAGVVEWFTQNGIDGVGLVLVAGFALLGAWRGLWWQVVRLVGLLGAVLAARTLAPDLAAWIEARWQDSDAVIVAGASWLLVFLAALILAVLLGRLGKRLLEALKLSLLDRAGGVVAGLATGALLHASVVTVVLHLAPGGWSNRHIAGTRSAQLVELLGDRAKVLFDSSTALALEAKRGEGAND